MAGRTQYLDQTDAAASEFGGSRGGEPRWSVRRMLVVSALLSVGLWTPILYLAAKVFGR